MRIEICYKDSVVSPSYLNLLASSKETKKISKLKPKTNDSTTKNVKIVNVKETVFILGDSMVKKVNNFLLTRNINHKYLVKVRPFSSAKVGCMIDHVECYGILTWSTPFYTLVLTILKRREQSQIAKSILDLCQSLKSDPNTITVSLIVPRYDNLNNKLARKTFK